MTVHATSQPRLAPGFFFPEVFGVIMPGYEQSPGPYWRPPRKIGGPVLFLVLLAGAVVLALAIAGFVLTFFG
jgi:hypothetical protein